MPQLVDQYGNPVYSNQRFASSSARYDGSRPYMKVALADIDKLIPSCDWQVLVSVSRKLFTNMGIPRGAILQKAKHSIGNAWNPEFHGSDRKWGDYVTSLLMDEWYGNCDVRGHNFDMKTNLFLDSIAVDRDGDFGIYQTDSRYPLLQRISAHHIGSRGKNGKVQRGRGRNQNSYVGLTNSNGVILSKTKQPIAYQILGETEAEDEYIDADRMIHVFDPTWHEQSRGLPALVHALNDLRDALQSQQWEQMAQLMLSSIALVEYNERGAADENDLRNHFTSTPNPTVSDMPTTTMLGGLIRYMKANGGGKIEQIEQDRPGDLWDRFQDRLARTSLAGMDWPISMVWKNEGNTAVQRADIMKARTSIADRQLLFQYPFRRQIGFAVAKFIKMGRVKPNNEWWKWGYTKPPLLSIDPNRDAKTAQADYLLGGTNMSQIVSSIHGRNLTDHYRERAHEVVLRKQIAAEVTEETGWEVTDADMQKIPNAPVDNEEKPPGKPPKPSSEDEDEDEE